MALTLWRWDAEILAPEGSVRAFREAVAALPEKPPREFLRWSRSLAPD